MTDRYESLKDRNLFHELLELRDRQRQAGVNALQVIEGEKIPIELSEWGRIQWYVHPAMTDVASRAILFWVMHIPPKSRTGLLRCQGGYIFQIWRGSAGHTVLDGERHDWGLDCVINIPLRPGGVTFQHVNDGDDEVLMLGSCLNLVDPLTVDAGSGFEILEPCPEWAEAAAAASGARA